MSRHPRREAASFAVVLHVQYFIPHFSTLISEVLSGESTRDEPRSYCSAAVTQRGWRNSGMGQNTLTFLLGNLSSPFTATHD